MHKPEFWGNRSLNSDLELTSKIYVVHFAISADHRGKIQENEKIGKYLDFARELKKTVEHKDDSVPSWCTRKGLQKLVKRLKELEIKGRIETLTLFGLA